MVILLKTGVLLHSGGYLIKKKVLQRPILSGLRKIQLAFISFTLFSPVSDVALVWLSSGLLSTPSATAPCWAALRGRCVPPGAPNALLCLFGLMCLNSLFILLVLV